MSGAEFWIVQALNGLQLSMLLFLLSVGLTVIFGLMHFVNLAHGALYMLGAYFGVAMVSATGQFWLALIVAPIGVMAVGMGLYQALIRHMRRQGPMNQVLVTFGLIFVLVDLVRILWGNVGLGISVPELLHGPVQLFGISYPAYRLFIILLGLAVMLALGLVLTRTAIGAMLRASVENAAMAATMGINVERLLLWVFALGCALAGLAGVIAAPVFSATPSMATDILIPTLIVVVVGGLGSLRGAVLGSLTVGFVQTFGAVLVPGLASLLIYALLAAILILRPQGLLPARQ
ncbi:branched-chain amino acid ABC transporter permease [Pseudohoeflea coraliihabitans]|uniref:Branched-chain amino acid ABC transporter permease n=1 Tax=Pseudohoeflea coraliihabitans TaxID=2860393 RepID=A0ABS6WT84_9HYPH|nr:branched-chain amino acid ABC transporter permease [Pseudohoeflea sp. DP4N28-3]MBW3098823.1 branched-chain amino acid ABC transporter permease [Pseudohoeflea sp. DP4N28-3]